MDETIDQTGGGLAGIPAGPMVKGPATKGGLSLPNGVPLDPKDSASVLEALQRMIDQRTGPMAQFMSGLSDAAAWTVPNLHGGKSQALAQRQQSRNQEMQDVFNMQSQMAALRSAQKQAQNQGELIGNIIGGNQGNINAGAGSQGNVGNVFGGPQPSGQRPGNIEPPPEVKRGMEVMLAQGDRKGALDIYNKWLAGQTDAQTKFNYNPEAQTQKPYFISQLGKSVDLTPQQYMQYQQTGQLPGMTAGPTGAPPPGAPMAPQQAPGMSGPAAAGAPAAAPAAPTAGGVNQFNVGNVRPAGQTKGFQQPGSFEEGLKIMDQNLQTYGSKYGINTLRGVISRWSPPNENDTNGLIKAAAQRLGIDPDQPIDLSNPAQRQAIGMAIMLQEKGPKGIFSAPAPGQAPVSAPGTSPTAAQGPRPTNMAEEKVQREIAQKRQEAEIEAQKTGIAEEHKEAATFITNLGKEASHAVDMKEAANRVINLVKNNPDIVGWRTKSDVPAMALQGLSGISEKAASAAEGVYGAGMGMVKGKDVGGMRNQLKTDSDKLGLYTAGQMFAGNKNLGIGLEKLVANSKGVGPDASAKTNLINATVIKNGAERSIAINDGWRTFKDANPNATAMDFVRSPAFKDIDSRYEAAVRRDLVDLIGEKEVNKYIGPSHSESKSGRPSLNSFGSRKGN